MIHEPVMTDEILSYLAPQRGGLFVDCTVGLGGHTRALLAAGASQVLGLDRDRESLDLAAATLRPWADRVELVHADLRNAENILSERGLKVVDGVLADLGMSSYQLETEGRGFSFRRDDPLDMRMDRSTGPTAADLLREASEAELAHVMFEYGEERHSWRVARAIVTARKLAPVSTTGQLAGIIRQALPRRGYQRIDPATRVFQAIRIWVNRELDGLDTFLQNITRQLRAGARLVVMTFHSLEDRIVKYALRSLERGDEVTVRVLTKRPIRPQASEVIRNRRARSAKLRVAEKLT